MKKIKNIIIILILILGLASCGNNVEKKQEQKKHNLTKIDEKQINYNTKKLDKKGRELVIQYFETTDENKKEELKKKIEEHMLEIQAEIKNIKGDTIKEKNEQIQRITRKIKLYKSLGF